jgi:hypothetical protein
VEFLAFGIWIRNKKKLTSPSVKDLQNPDLPDIFSKLQKKILPVIELRAEVTTSDIDPIVKGVEGHKRF